MLVELTTVTPGGPWGPVAPVAPVDHAGPAPIWVQFPSFPSDHVFSSLTERTSKFPVRPM